MTRAAIVPAVGVGAFDVPAAQRVGVDGATGHGLAALPSVLDGRVLALVAGDLDAAAGVVAHGHAAFAAPADGQALQQRDPFPGRAGKQFRRVNGHLHLRHSGQLSNVKSPNLLGPTCTMTR